MVRFDIFGEDATNDRTLASILACESGELGPDCRRSHAVRPTYTALKHAAYIYPTLAEEFLALLEA
jgi:hypothetical protein